jgi:hypothetical protein
MVDEKTNNEQPAVENGKVNWGKLPTAVRHQYVQELTARLAGCHKEDVFEVFGTWYKLRTLDPTDTDWTYQFVQGGDLYSIAQSKRAPSVAAALRGFGPEKDKILPIEELFKIPSDLPETTQKLIEGSKYFERDWRRLEVFKWLTAPNEGQDELIKVLYDRLLSLHNQRDAALGALGPLAKKTLTGASSATSSPEQGGGSTTQVSAS